MTDPAHAPSDAAAAAHMDAIAPMLARQALSRPGGSVAALRSLETLCRRAGDLDMTAALARRIVELDPADARAAYLDAFLARRPARFAPDADVAWPIPFVRMENFLSPADRAAMAEAVMPHLDAFEATTVNDDGEGKLNHDYRVSTMMPTAMVGPAREIIVPHVQRLIDALDVPALMNLPRPGERIEFQITCSGDGAFFGAHADRTDTNLSHRMLTFVYYFNRAPGSFGGGDLRIFDGFGDRKVSMDSFTRVKPIDNSIILFPSWAVHEVERVSVPSRDPADGRFTANAWFYHPDFKG
jgi:hypothetical protein